MSLTEQLASLNQVAAMAAKDQALYEQYVPSLLELSSRPEKELRQWLADFLLDALASGLTLEKRRELALKALTVIEKLMDGEPKTPILLSALVYPLVFSSVALNPKLSAEWTALTALKERITSIWGADPSASVEIACIKFAQQLVLVQSRGQSGPADPRLAARSKPSTEANMSMVPPNHPLIHRSLEAEGQGSLDRLLGNLTGDDLSQDVQKIAEPIFTATVFALAPILKQRPEYGNRILQTVLAVDPVAMESKFTSKLAVRFCEKSLKMLVTHCLRNKIHVQLRHRMERFLAEVGRKRPAPVEEQMTKRQKTEEPVPAAPAAAATPVNMSTTMPPDADSYSALFTLIPANDPLVAFDARTLPQQLALQIALTGLLSVDEAVLRSRAGVVKQRWDNWQQQEKLKEESRKAREQRNDPREAGGRRSDSQDYRSESRDYDDRDRERGRTMSREYNNNHNQNNNTGRSRSRSRDVSMDSRDSPVSRDSSLDSRVSDYSHTETDSAVTFQLPPPEPLSESEKVTAGTEIVSRFMAQKDVAVAAAKSLDIQKNAISKLAINEWTGGSWMVILSRLLSRGLAYDPETEPADSLRVQLSSHIRNQLLNMATTAFTANFEDIMTWLNEEWYSELIRHGQVNPASSIYYEYASRIMDTLVQTIDPDNWKYFIRLVGELPELDYGLVSKLKHLLIDPDRSVIGVRSLKYLIMLRPPTRDFCLDVIEEVYQENESLRGGFKQVLGKYRPLVVEGVEKKLLEAKKEDSEEPKAIKQE
ncbi:Pre-tRNA-processing protein [Yarrowia sp. C11]|nr:Pre-tRNA-processing protein [Yarrowia sp. C11]